MKTGNKRNSIWKHRSRRYATGLNVFVAVLLAAVLMTMFNYLAARYGKWRRDLSWQKYYTLSEKTRGLLAGIDGNLRIVAFLRRSHPLYQEVRALLAEYEYAASAVEGLRLKIDVVDPERELAKTTRLSKELEVREANVIVFAKEGRRKFVTVKDLSEYERAVDYEKLMRGEPSVREKRISFRGEQVFSSAILSVTQVEQPTVYFLKGHGERDPADYGRQTGYSGISRLIHRDNIQVESLLLGARGGVPQDCDALIIAGADRRLSDAEVDAVKSYLERNGRVFLLIDPLIRTGLEALLSSWGVRLQQDVVVGLTLTGRELFVSEYGPHPITRPLNDLVTMFYMPRSVEPMRVRTNPGAAPADEAQVVGLAYSSEKGWAEVDLNQNPPVFDAGQDRQGPVSVAVAVERGAVSGIQVELRPTRMVVVGDSDFISNGALNGGVGGNVDFFMSALNWLLEREELIAITPKPPSELRLDMHRGLVRTAFLLIVLGLPAVVAVAGLLVWVCRRR